MFDPMPKLKFKQLSIRYQVLASMLLPMLGFCYFFGSNAIGHARKGKEAEDTMLRVEIARKLVGMATQLQEERQTSLAYLSSGSEGSGGTLVDLQKKGNIADMGFREAMAGWRGHGWDASFTVLLDNLVALPVSDTDDGGSSAYGAKDPLPFRERVLSQNVDAGEVLEFFSGKAQIIQSYLATVPAFVGGQGAGSGLAAVSGLAKMVEGSAREACHIQAILLEGKVSQLPDLRTDHYHESLYAAKEQAAGLSIVRANSVRGLLGLHQNLAGEWEKGIDQVREELREGIAPASIGVDVQAWESLTSARQEHYLNTTNHVLDEIYQWQEDVLSSSSVAFWLDAVVLCIFLASFGGGMWILQRASARITHLTSVAETLAKGDVSPEIQTAGEDDLGQMAEAFRKMILYLKDRAKISTQVSKGNYGMWVELSSDADELGLALKGMVYKLHLESAKQHKREWIQEGQQELSQVIASISNMEAFSNDVIAFLCNYLNAEAGLIYVLEDAKSIDGSTLGEKVLALSGIFSCTSDSVRRKFVKEGEGLVGECLRNPQVRMLDDVAEDYLPVGSGFGEMPPRYIMVAPIQLGDIVIGVVELAAMNPFSEDTLLFWESISEALGTSFLSKQESRRTERLLQQTQHQAAVLQSQQEELQAQTEALTRSKADLEDQKQKLQETNVELEHHATQLAHQKQHLEKAQGDLQNQAEELELASKYKSEFMASMSHELRTPLNALLILAQNLSENKGGNLTDKQVKWSKIIHGSGTDLLSIINDILDLSKIEAGMLEVHLDPIKLKDIAGNMLAVSSRLPPRRALNSKSTWMKACRKSLIQMYNAFPKSFGT